MFLGDGRFHHGGRLVEWSARGIELGGLTGACGGRFLLRRGLRPGRIRVSRFQPFGRRRTARVGLFGGGTGGIIGGAGCRGDGGINIRL
jgi:hypothetical protein